MRMSRGDVLTELELELGEGASPEGMFRAYSILQDPQAVLEDARESLLSAGVAGAEELDLTRGEDVVLLAEAVNWAAKELDGGFYAIKPAAFVVAALHPRVSSGWDWPECARDWGCFYISSPGAGEVSAHDPYGEIVALAKPLGLNARWESGWCGIRRQHLAFDALVSRDVRRLIDAACGGAFTDTQVDRMVAAMERRRNK